MTSRLKRKAASKLVIIDSDSEDYEPDDDPVKKSRTTLKTNTTGKPIEDTDGERKKRPRWPDKKGKAKNTSHLSESTENLSPNAEIELARDSHQDVEQTDGQCLSLSSTDQGTRRVSGRNSFWARRKVWDIHELLAETQNIEPTAARNIVQLFENENTIPFICRYRRDLINQMTPEQLREIKDSYTEIVGLRKKATTIVQQLEKDKVIDEDMREEMLSAKTSEELEFLYAPYKPANKGSLAERAKGLGLEPYANQILFGEEPEVQIHKIVDQKNPDLDTEAKVMGGICNIISHNISKHTGVLEELRKLQKVHKIVLKSSKAKATNSTKKESTKSKAATSQPNTHHNSKNDESKYEIYFDYQSDYNYLKPHQVLAINRGEKQKFLSVKVITNDYLKRDLNSFIWNLYMNEGIVYPLRKELFQRSVEDCISKKLLPLLQRQIRADLNDSAKKAAIEVFAKNLKQLLLMSPLKGQRILGLDPGFSNGCKFALISETADVLETGVFYPHTRNNDPEIVGEALAKVLAKHNCSVIALGNGTACRETEFWLTNLFQIGILNARTTRYSIVSEQGASIYSCSEIARKEFPNLDMNVISAVSIARRLNDPLSEYVKIEPRHIGVGMYQHDVNEKSLTESLNDVVSECVSFVGVDINTASISVLKHVAGLSEKKAEKIIQHRLEKGSFRTRKDLLKVKTIGDKTFVQCAGFVRIEPRSLGGEIENLLDCTWVHPESYLVAKKIITKSKLKLEDIGSVQFIAGIKDFIKKHDIDNLANECKMPKERLEIVFVALQRNLFQDYRADFDKKPLFKQGVTRINDLSEGDIVTGAVTNITNFGAFVDIGVECDGLIHVSKIPKGTNLNIGDRITASVIQINIQRKRIGLRLEDMIMETDTSFTLASC